MQVAGPSIANTAAVVVIFNPEGDFGGRLRRVVDQVALVIVVANDNGPRERLASLPADKTIYLPQRTNIGLATALNRGMSAASDSGAQWCLLLDQDSEVDCDLVSSLAEVHRDHPARGKIAILAPNYRSPGSGRLAYSSAQTYVEARAVITSGSILRLSAAASLGGMMEPFFIEGIDLEYCLRARKEGFLIAASGRPLMTHGAGRCEERRILRRTVLVANHAPWRYYLQFRNLTWILCHYGTFDPAWSFNAATGLAKKLALILFFESDRMRKVAAILKGVGHGLTGQLGYEPNERTRDDASLQ